MRNIKIGEYLFKRLHELGIRSVFGVPGDYESTLLDLAIHAGLDWKGNPSEMIASYAANSCAQNNEAAAFVKTFGPGELSVYCGMTSKYSEQAPVSHILTYLTLSALGTTHHSPSFGQSNNCVSGADDIMSATTIITDASAAAVEIDRVLNVMVRESRSVYIGISTEVANQTIYDALSRLTINSLPRADIELEKKAANEILSRLEKASRPTIIVDGGAVRHKLIPEVNDFIELTSFPAFVTGVAKSGVNEKLPNFRGFCGGTRSYAGVKETVVDSDAVLWIGNHSSDVNTVTFITAMKEEVTINFQQRSVKVGKVEYNIPMARVLQTLLKILRAKLLLNPPTTSGNPFLKKTFTEIDTLKPDFLWPSLTSFFKPGDVVIAETDTSAFGLCDSHLPEGVIMFNPTISRSNSYTASSLVGIGQVIKESQGQWKRPILITGEGSTHMTIQTIADMLQWDLKPIVFVLNSGAYTFERLVFDEEEAFYSEVSICDYGALAKAFGPEVPSKYYGPIRTCGDLTNLLKLPELGHAHCFELVEFVLDKLDDSDR